MSRSLFLPCLVAVALALPRAAGCEDAPLPDGPAADFDRALDAVRRGEIKPLSEIMPSVEKAFGGRAVETEIETDHGRWVYEFEILTPDGRLFEVDVDAVTGETVNVEEEVD